MKKNTKKKLSRKDKFKELKKEAIPMSSAPLFLKKTYGINTISESGLFQVGDGGVFSKLYRLEIRDSTVKAQDVFTILREYDFKFRIYYIHDEIYLNILCVSDKSDAWVSCDELFKDMKNKFFDFSISIEDIEADERMKIVHGLILNNENLPFGSSYLDNKSILDWKEDFELTGLKEEIDCLKKADDSYKIFYVREFSDKVSEFISEILLMEDVEEVITQFEPVSDKAVQAFFKYNYMGAENLLEDMAKKNPKVFDIYTKKIKDDSRHFTMCGAMFLVKNNNPDVEEKIKFSASRYDIEISYFHVRLLDAYKEFLPIGSWVLSELRNVSSERASKLLLPNYLVSEEQEENIDDFLLDSDLFDFEDETPSKEDTSFNIDDYEEDDDNNDNE